MTSQKKLEANRQNAKRSTGPRTDEGKARASRNALKHGVLAAAPVVREMERTEEWEAHLEGVRSSLQPVGYLEDVLVDRVALLLWRMGRVARFERDSITAAVETAADSMKEESVKWMGESAEGYARTEDTATRAVNLLYKLETAPPDERVDNRDAEAALSFMDELTPQDTVVSIPGVPDDEDERWVFEGWTVGLFRGALEAYGRVLKDTAEGVRMAAGQDAEAARLKAHRDAAAYHAALDRRKRKRLLLDERVMDNVLRYETTMERAFLRSLHELQRLQAVRGGGSVPPPLTLDVNLSGASGDGAGA